MAKRTGDIVRNGVTIELVNDAETRKVVNNIVNSIGPSMAKAIADSCATVTNTAKKLVRVDTGDLAKSITYNIVTENKKEVHAVVGPTEDVIYGKYIEYGTGIYAVGGNGRKTPWRYYYPKLGHYVTTSGMTPKPFLYPALQRSMKRINAIMAQAVKEGWGTISEGKSK